MISELWKWILPFGLMSFAGEGQGGGGDEGNEGAPGDTGGEDNTSKAELEALQAKYDRALQENEDLRLEVMTPEYMDFLDKKDSGKGNADTGAEKPPVKTGEDLENMSKKDLVDHLRKIHQEDLRKLKDDLDNTQKVQTRREVEAFSRSHADYAQYRPVMYGLSLDPKNANLTLQELYDKSKEHVKRLRTEPTDEEKDKSRKSQGEKPGGASESFDDLKKLSAEEAATKAMAEVKEKLGDIPSA